MNSNRKGTDDINIISRRDLKPTNYLQCFCPIVTKNNQEIPFRPNTTQGTILSQLKYTIHGLPTNNNCLILKSRQRGVSTILIRLNLSTTMLFKGLNTHTICSDDKNFKELSGIARYFYANIPNKLKPSTEKGYFSRNEMTFPTRGGARFHLSLAGSTERVASNVGRGGKIYNLHLSEFAFYMYPELLLSGVMPALVANGNSYIESTPNGVGGVFYDKVIQAYKTKDLLRKEVGKEYKLFFFPWYSDPDCYFELADPKLFMTTYSIQEQDLALEYNLKPEQIAFRRHKISQLGNENKFRQEYPLTIMDCFLVSGRPFFDLSTLEIQENNVKPAILLRNTLYIWAMPISNRTYTMGVDTSEGISGDYNCARIFDNITGEEVACIYNNYMQAHDFAQFLARVGQTYNNALIAVERNNYGHAILAKLSALRYPNIFYMLKPLGDGRLGWCTNKKSRALMLDLLSESLKDNIIKPHFDIGYAELRTFIRDKEGRPVAMRGKHDDTVMALAIANYVIQLGLSNKYNTNYEKDNRWDKSYQPFDDIKYINTNTFDRE